MRACIKCSCAARRRGRRPHSPPSSSSLALTGPDGFAIVWSESVHGLERLLGDRCQRLFDKRIAYRLDEASMDQLVMEEDEAEGKTAVYMDIRQDVRNTHFRPYDLPARVWMEDYAGAVQARIAERGGQ